MKNNNQLINVLKSYENKKIKIFLKNGFTYDTSDLKVVEDVVVFHDKYGKEVMILLCEITQITEVGK